MTDNQAFIGYCNDLIVNKDRQSKTELTYNYVYNTFAESAFCWMSILLKGNCQICNISSEVRKAFPEMCTEIFVQNKFHLNENSDVVIN